MSSNEKKILLSPLFLVLLGGVPLFAAPLRVKTTFQNGVGISDVLVIVKSLEGKGEIFRALTDSKGAVPERDLAPGLYRIIATCPYGICETRVSEFLVRSGPVDVELQVEIPPPHGYGDVIPVPPQEKVTMKLIDARGNAMPATKVLVRDSTAENERWYKTNAEGETEFDIYYGALVVVVLHDDLLTEQTVSGVSMARLRVAGKKLVIQVDSASRH